MSSVINPVGPEEPSTYWRRRAVVLVALLVVLLLAWWVVSAALGGSDEAPTDGASPTPSFGLTMSPEPGASTGEGSPESGPATDGASPTGSSSPAAGVACTDADIAVTASAAKASATVGAGLELSLNVENTGSTACSRDLGPGANELRVTSGTALVWSSDFCSASTESEIVTLEPGEGRTSTATWPGTITTEGCPADQPAAQAGSYRVIARNGVVESEPVPFVVE